MILGCYYLTRTRTGELGEGSKIGSYEEADIAYANQSISLHARIDFRDEDDGSFLSTSLSLLLFITIFITRVVLSLSLFFFSAHRNRKSPSACAR